MWPLPPPIWPLSAFAAAWPGRSTFSGDERATAERLERLGVPPALVDGDSCARTTWENATRTAAWLRQHHPGAPVLLITDPWQLPRAARAFARQGVAVQPLAQGCLKVCLRWSWQVSQHWVWSAGFFPSNGRIPAAESIGPAGFLQGSLTLLLGAVEPLELRQ